jgi:hypothetical protein
MKTHLTQIPFLILGFGLFALAQAGAQRVLSEQVRTMQWSEGRKSLKLTIKGDVRFTDDDADVRSISRDGSLVIDQNDGSTERKLELSPSSGGTLNRVYSVDGKSRKWDTKAQAWLAKLLPELIRESAIDAQGRVKRIRDQKGARGVLEEIALIRSDGAKRIYFQELFESGELSSDMLKHSAQMIDRGIHSDGDKASLLGKIAKAYLRDDALLPGFFAAVGSIHSDGDRRRVLTLVLQESDLSDSAVGFTLKSAAAIASDGDKASVLARAATVIPNQDSVQYAYLDAVRTIHSDGDKHRALSGLLQRSDLSVATLSKALELAQKEIRSDGDRKRVVQLVEERRRSVRP